jgi:hypothetical protein
MIDKCPNKSNAEIKKYFEDNNVIVKDIYFFTDHDGYDRDGPKSNLYYCNVFIEENGKIFHKLYYHEYWFTRKEDNKWLYLQDSNTLEKFKEKYKYYPVYTHKDLLNIIEKLE